MSKVTLFLSAVLVSHLVGCAHINSVSLTPIPAKRTQTVRAEVSKTIFLFFNFDNNYIDPLVNDLKQQCPDGIVSGILTKDETTSYVLVFTKRVVATGFCNLASAKASTSKSAKKRSTASEEDDETVEN
jgi:hypothetical protein